ncbi:hypothetical protein F2Q69_00036360 [Brassica cretica]|uniref:Uncharacterized protein n=1 Tax=Brassica cretica TaxID=69181 RepID=A0A8S9SKQ9_BRACR|nr:hypothetical protein F2Q69_00036360 [Brassica cretica]
MSSRFFTNRLWFYGARDIDHNWSKFEAFFNQHECFAFDVPTNEPKTLSSPSGQAKVVKKTRRESLGRSLGSRGHRRKTMTKINDVGAATFCLPPRTEGTENSEDSAHARPYSSDASEKNQIRAYRCSHFNRRPSLWYECISTSPVTRTEVD